jgi:hypothetical protein
VVLEFVVCCGGLGNLVVGERYISVRWVECDCGGGNALRIGSFVAEAV